MAFSPELKRVDPPGGQRGTKVEVVFRGERLDDVKSAIFYQPGLSLSGLVVKDGKTAAASLNIAADAPAGEHSLRLAGEGGITELRTFWVGDFPTVKEVEPNGGSDPPQRIELNHTAHGVVVAEDEDYYVCGLKKGQRLSVEVEAMRLGRTLFDVSVAILDERGFELAVCDDVPLLRTDAFVSILAPEDGDYRILVREAAYEGGDQCQYRLHIGSFPRPTAVFPPGGKPGETLEFTFTGDPSGPIRESFTLPAEARDDFPLFPKQDGLSAPSPLWIAVSALESVRESGDNRDPKTATRAPAPPCALHGILDQENSGDWFGFDAKKGEALVLSVIARSHRSPLDAVLSVHDMKGKLLIANDDQGTMDSLIQWTCPADGGYLLKIRDQLNRHGPDFIYRIEITKKSPGLAATLPTVERNLSQKWKVFPVPRGNRYAALINLARENIACDAVFEAGSLPPGVKMHVAGIPRSVTTFPVVFEAAADAPMAAGLHGFLIRSDGDAPPLSGRLSDTIHHVEVNNEGAYHSVTLDRVAMGVTSEAPFRVELDAPAVPIVKNGTLALKVRLVRQKDFKEKVTVKFLWKPPGISGPVSVDIPADESGADYELNASADAAPGEWQVCVLAEAGTPQGPVVVSSALTRLEIAEPYVAMTLDLAATGPGKDTVMLGGIETLRPFSGAAKVYLSSLPHGVTCPPLSFTAGQTEISFPLAVSAEAKLGKHSGIFCVLAVPVNGSEVIHQTGMGGVLRVDPPPGKTAARKAAPVAANKNAGAPEKKPLSRLEQLRQGAK